MVLFADASESDINTMDEEKEDDIRLYLEGDSSEDDEQTAEAGAECNGRADTSESVSNDVPAGDRENGSEQGSIPHAEEDIEPSESHGSDSGVEDDDSEDDSVFPEDLDYQVVRIAEKVWASALAVPGQKQNSEVFLDEDTSYVYRISSSDKWARYLRCRHDYCYARGVLKLYDDNCLAIRQTGRELHNHEPEPTYLASKLFRQSLYNRAQSESKALSEIYKEEANK